MTQSVHWNDIRLLWLFFVSFLSPTIACWAPENTSQGGGGSKKKPGCRRGYALQIHRLSGPSALWVQSPENPITPNTPDSHSPKQWVPRVLGSVSGTPSGIWEAESSWETKPKSWANRRMPTLTLLWENKVISIDEKKLLLSLAGVNSIPRNQRESSGGGGEERENC